jgi:L-seryl-tRNA(Ser) seleniumtransferase
MKESSAELLRRIPQVGGFLDSPEGAALAAEFGAGLVKLELRSELEALRVGLRSAGHGEIPGAAELARRVRSRLVRLALPAGRRAINATGIILHTGLGRAPLCAAAAEAVAAMGRYSVLQADRETGSRSLREEKVERLLIELTGCEAAAVVNNNAAATMLALNTLADGREVVVSRGQLIEIGGSYRLPDVMARSGAIMREVGTTNRTHLRDYETAVGEATGALIHVHTSNYRVRGFAGTPDLRQLCALGRSRSVPVIDDLGSGALVRLAEFGLGDEPLVAESIAAGAELACFSGDKLICGPQCGIVCGRRETVERLRRNPFARMFRVCKLTMAALEATLIHFVNEDWREALPLYRMLARPVDELDSAAASLNAELTGVPGLAVRVSAETAYVGSGTLPDQGLPSRTVALAPSGLSVDEFARRLRSGSPAVFGRIAGGELLLDMRTVFPDEVAMLAARVREARAVG